MSTRADLARDVKAADLPESTEIAAVTTVVFATINPLKTNKKRTTLPSLSLSLLLLLLLLLLL